MTIPPPTPRQLQVLDALQAWMREHDGEPPTLRELAIACKSSLRTVTEHVIALRRKGLVAHTTVTRVRMVTDERGLSLTDAGVHAATVWRGVDAAEVDAEWAKAKGEA